MGGKTEEVEREAAMDLPLRSLVEDAKRQGVLLPNWATSIS